MYDIIIIGGGIVGTSIARRLSRYKLSILLLEKSNDVSMGSTKANSAIVHGGYAESHDKLKGRLCYKGRMQYEQLNKELNFGFSKIGSLVIAFDEKDLDELEKLKENGEKNGLRDLKIISHDEIMKMNPAINPEVKYALYCEGAGVTSPYEMAIAMMENAIHNGVELKLNTEVSSIEKNNEELFQVKTADGNIYGSKIVINCAGINSGEISRMVGIDDFTVHPRTGEYILFARGTGSLLNNVIFQMPTKKGKGILVTPTYHGNLLIGPDAIDENSADLGTNEERLINIYNQALKTTKGLQPSKFIRSFAGARAVASTDDFIIENSKQVPGFIQCAGIQSPGLTSAPAIADLVTQIIENEIMELEENPDYDPYRKPIITKKELMPPKDAMKYVNMESGDERMVCRCEQVTEATIRDALTREIPVTTIDGVKRRTRAGMGYCQGTFCGPRVKAFMEKVLGKPVDDGTDVKHSGINRVEKSQFNEYLKKISEKQ